MVGWTPQPRRVTIASGSVHDPSHVNTHISGIEPGKNRAVCLGIGGKSVLRNVTLQKTWGGAYWHDCFCLCLSRNFRELRETVLRQQDKNSGIVGPRSVIATLFGSQNYWFSDMKYTRWHLHLPDTWPSLSSQCHHANISTTPSFLPCCPGAGKLTPYRVYETIPYSWPTEL